MDDIKEKLKYKIKNGPRIESLVEYELENGTVVAIFQGSRGSYPELDFIVKYVDPGKRIKIWLECYVDVILIYMMLWFHLILLRKETIMNYNMLEPPVICIET